MSRKKKEIVTRYPKNPILTGKDFPDDIVSVFNSSVVKQGPKKYIMVCRVEDTALCRYMWCADSQDGVHFKPRPKPLDLPMHDPLFKEYVGGTVSYYDPRVTEIEGQYYIVHAAQTRYLCTLGLFKADREIKKLEWMGLISEPDNRNGVLFPEKIKGLYWRLDRPNEINDIWVANSPNLTHWGGFRSLVRKDMVRWAYTKIGGGAVPIKTKKGWLCIIHAVRTQCNSLVYSLGVMLLDLNDPYKLLGISQRCLLEPQELYEHQGQAPHVVFTTGAVAEPDGSVKIYYGGADKVMCLATADLDELVWSCLNE